MTAATNCNATQRPEGLSARQLRAVLALLAEPTLDAAAAASGCRRETLWRWMQQEAFRAEYLRARRAAVDQAIGALQQATSEAVATLRRCLSCCAPAQEVAAAKAILDGALRGLEIADIESRLERVEAALAARQERGKQWG